MATESGGKDDVSVVRMVSDNGVLVPGVVVVETAPGIFHLKKKAVKNVQQW